MNNQTPTYYDKYSVAERYAVGIAKAGDIIRAIRLTCGGGALPVGKVLPAELTYWEQKYNRFTPVPSPEKSQETSANVPFQFDKKTAQSVAEEIIEKVESVNTDDRVSQILTFFKIKYGVGTR